jgi:hypothetical protein
MRLPVAGSISPRWSNGRLAELSLLRAFRSLHETPERLVIVARARVCEDGYRALARGSIHGRGQTHPDEGLFGLNLALIVQGYANARSLILKGAEHRCGTRLPGAAHVLV